MIENKISIKKIDKLLKIEYLWSGIVSSKILLHNNFLNFNELLNKKSCKKYF